MQIHNTTGTVKNCAGSRKVKAKMATKTLVIIAMLTALGVVCSMSFPYGLTLRIGNDLKFTLTFLVIALAARKYGVFAAAIVAGLSDLIQTLVAGYGIPNPLISASAILTGIIFGVCFHKKVTLSRIFIAVISTSVLCSLILTTSALVFMFSTPFIPLIYWRLLQTLLMSVLEVVVLHFLFVKSNILYKIKFLDK